MSRLRTPQAAAYIGLAPTSLEKDRVMNTLKIPYLKLGRSVVYDTEMLDSWLASRIRTSTSDMGGNHA